MCRAEVRLARSLLPGPLKFKIKKSRYEQDDSPRRVARLCRPRLAADSPYVQFCKLLRSPPGAFRRPPGAERRHRGSGRGFRNPSARQHGDRVDRAGRRAQARRQHGQHESPASGRDSGDVGRHGHHAQRDERQRDRAGQVPADMGADRRAEPPPSATFRM